MKVEDIQVGMWVRNYGKWEQVVGTRRKIETAEYIDQEGWSADVVTLTVRGYRGALLFPQYQAGEEIDARTEEPQ